MHRLFTRPLTSCASLPLAIGCLAFSAALPGPAANAAPAPAMQWQSAQLGNIFQVGEAANLSLQVNADKVDWTITDFWHKEVKSGSTPVSAGKADIKTGITAPGYYLIHAKPQNAGAALPDGYTSFAVVRPHVSKDPINSPFGAMTHFAQGMNPVMLGTLKKIGIESIRDEHYWAQVEKTKGVYQFAPKSDAYMEACKTTGINPLVAMTFGNKLYDSEKGPSTPAGYEGYGKYGQAILDHYGKQIHWLEIWNEYNGTWCPDATKNARPKFYAEMLKTAYQSIKSKRPDVQVLGGAAVLIPLPYFEGIFKNNGLQYMDGVVIHPYRAKPEGVDNEVADLQALIRQYNGGKEKPVWVTETGRHTTEEYDWETGRKMYEKGRAEGARYLPRQYTLLLKQHVAKIYWYLASDHATFISMGLLRNHAKEDSGMGLYAVAPAYVSYATLINQLDGATFVRREAAREYTRAYVELFQRGADEVRVCWATQPSKIRIKAMQPLKVTNIMGAESIVTPVNGEALFDLSEDIVYIQGKATGITEVDTGSRVIASSSDDYTKTQGGNNWYYGYKDNTGFKELKQVETVWGYTWGGVGRNLSISPGSMHPDKLNGQDAAVVRRWKSPVDAKILIKSTWTNGGKGNGVRAAIVVDGKEIYTQQVGGGSPEKAEGEVSAEVKKGSFVDFQCTPDNDPSFDATGGEYLIIQK